MAFFLCLLTFDFYIPFLFGLLYPFSIWTFISLFYLDINFPFFIWTFFFLLYPFSKWTLISRFLYGLFIFLLYPFFYLDLCSFFLFGLLYNFFSISRCNFVFLPTIFICLENIKFVKCVKWNLPRRYTKTHLLPVLLMDKPWLLTTKLS